MISRTRFNKNKPVFACHCCGHNTRLTSDLDGICVDCFELFGIDNAINDGEISRKKALNEADEYIENIRKRGGDQAAQRAKEYCTSIWPNMVNTPSKLQPIGKKHIDRYNSVMNEVDFSFRQIMRKATHISHVLDQGIFISDLEDKINKLREVVLNASS